MHNVKNENPPLLPDPTFLKHILILFVIHTEKLHFYFLCSPKRALPPLPHPQVPEAFVGTPILKASQKVSR